MIWLLKKLLTVNSIRGHGSIHSACILRSNGFIFLCPVYSENRCVGNAGICSRPLRSSVLIWSTINLSQYYVPLVLLMGWIWVPFMQQWPVTTYEMRSNSSWNLSVNNIFLYLELTEYYPLQNTRLAQQCTSPTAFSALGSTVWRLTVVSPSSHLSH
jgi:hypothetical protein